MKFPSFGFNFRSPMLLLLIAAPAAFALSERAAQLIEARLRSPAIVCVEGEACAKGRVVSDGLPRSGQEVYDASCTSCHAAGVGGAPLLSDRAGWSTRRAKGKQTLYQSVINGLNLMPPMGACADCSEAEIEAAVDYILEQI